ncbi:hypothetical protein D3C81_141780 [compost metagenome]
MGANTDHLFGYRGDRKKTVGRRFEDILLQNDGSTTKMLELIIGGEVTIKVHDQDWIFRRELPLDFFFPIEGSGPFIRRVTSLYYQDEVISSNLVFGNPDAISADLQERLIQGTLPIGKLIKEIEYRRDILFADYQECDQIRSVYPPGLLPEDGYPIKKYLMIRDGQWWFYIMEVFHMKTILSHMESDLNKQII